MGGCCPAPGRGRVEGAGLRPPPPPRVGEGWAQQSCSLACFCWGEGTGWQLSLQPGCPHPVTHISLQGGAQSLPLARGSAPTHTPGARWQSVAVWRRLFPGLKYAVSRTLGSVTSTGTGPHGHFHEGPGWMLFRGHILPPPGSLPAHRAPNSGRNTKLLCGISFLSVGQGRPHLPTGQQSLAVREGTLAPTRPHPAQASQAQLETEGFPAADL